MNSRFNALDLLSSRDKIQNKPLDTMVSEIFACNVFTLPTMQQYLAPKLYKAFVQDSNSGESLTRDLADHVAEAMRKWALQNNVTHYAHWFQPLTGRTAEKHDSFFTLNGNGEAIEEFTGNELVQQEPDGSSFPGGGLRSTFEARGYTAWDPTSPAFILDVNNQKTLCIPTIFVTYGGHSLDYKLPLLKSQAFLEKSAIDVCQLFDNNITKITVTLGWEQEYFLIDEALFNVRPDLMMTGRTLLGRLAPKGQQLDDHYFGSIPERVYAYMTDLEMECYKLGIPIRTRHNEVAPSQYEFAPIYEDVNIAVDHNQLLMDIMERVAIRHKLRVLFHEKPYAGVNGSGKHNNWSVATNTGKNLLSPGKDPAKNLQFLTFFVNTIYAVYKYADILRASVTSASNDHRLGANEAPPAIISVFIGEALTKILNEIEKGIEVTADGVKQALNLLSKIPNLQLDNTDRNRTSPFAFTGNKFEIRMVGSTMNCAAPMTIMNMIVGKQLKEFYQDVQILMANKTPKDQAVLTVLKHYIAESKSIQGNVVAAGMTPLIRIVNLNKMYIETNVPEAYLSSVVPGKTVYVDFPILNKTITASVRQAGNFINAANRTFKIEINIPNMDQLIKPNLTAKLRINDYSNESAFLIPQSIISENADGKQYVYIVQNTNSSNFGVTKRVIITTGKNYQDQVEVLNGLKSNMLLIEEGARSVKEGQEVEIINQ